MDIKNILGDPTSFVKLLISELNAVNIFISANQIDHLCYKPETFIEYEQIKEKLLSAGTLLTEAIINKRPIATYELHRPLVVDEYIIPLLELAAPKPNQTKTSHFEHFEVVLSEHSLSDFCDLYKGLSWDVSKINDKFNPDITIILPSGLVKFHPTSLKDVIEKAKIF